MDFVDMVRNWKRITPVTMSMKHFILAELSSLNFQADSEALADYIMALIESGLEVSSLQEHLQDFLQNSTQIFVEHLLAYTDTLNSNPNNTNNGSTDDDNDNVQDQVDYEDVDEEGVNSSVVSTTQSSVAQRPLREYSPERTITRESEPKLQLRACVNFSKYGSCKFGENCRYSHAAQAPRKPRQSSRIRLSNLPPSLFNPVALNEEMIKQGDVFAMSIFPERGEASIQFVRFEDAEKAIEAINSRNDGILAEFSKHYPQQQQKQVQGHGTVENNDSSSKLQSLIQLQKQQQSLLESNLTSQQALLNHLQGPSVTSEERIELISTLKRIQDSVMNIQELLKRTTELVVEAASSTAHHIPATNHHKNQRHQTQLLGKTHHHAPHPTSHNAQYHAPHHTSHHDTYRPLNGGVHKNTHPSHRAQYNQSSNIIRSTTSSLNNKLDLRPTTLKLGPLKSTNLTDIHALQRHFSPYGPIQSLIITDEGQGAIVKYKKFTDAQRALQNAGKEFSSDVNFSLIQN